MLSEQEQSTLDTYNKIAKGWTASQRPDFWDFEYAKFSNYLHQGKIIDVGCGSGRDSLWFSEIGFVAVKKGAGDKMLEWRQSGQKRYFVYYSQNELALLNNSCRQKDYPFAVRIYATTSVCGMPMSVN